MRIRLTLIAAVLAVLALAGLRGDDARAHETARGSEAATYVVAQPAPAVDPPVIVRATVGTPAAPQTHVDADARRDARPALDVLAAGPQAPVEPAYDVSRPRAFPLLI